MNVNYFIIKNSGDAPRWFITWLHRGLLIAFIIVVGFNTPWWVALLTYTLAFAIEQNALLRGWKNGVKDAVENPDDFKEL